MRVESEGWRLELAVAQHRLYFVSFVKFVVNPFVSFVKFVVNPFVSFVKFVVNPFVLFVKFVVKIFVVKRKISRSRRWFS